MTFLNSLPKKCDDGASEASVLFNDWKEFRDFRYKLGHHEQTHYFYACMYLAQLNQQHELTNCIKNSIFDNIGLIFAAWRNAAKAYLIF